MPNDFFNFKQFTIKQDRCAFKVGTDGVMLGAYAFVSGVSRILDIGSGTGLISMILAQRCEAEIIAIEPDNGSYIQSCENINRNPWNSRIKVIETTLQNFNSDLKFDLLISNPPYFTNSLRNQDQRKTVTRHTDTLSSSDLLAGAERLLSDNGKFQVIMPYVEGNLLIAEAVSYNLFCYDILKIRPLPTSEVKRLIITFSRTRKPVHEKFLTIEHGSRHEFTEDYKNLTKDFYLKF